MLNHIRKLRETNPALHTRLLGGLLLVSIIALSLLFYFVYTEVSLRIRQDRQVLMTEAADALLRHVDEWLDKNIRALKTAARQSGVRAMDREAQQEILENLQQEYPWIYLAFTLDKTGRNIARSDRGARKSYADRDYFRAVTQGEGLAWQTLIGKTSMQPALVLAIPIVRDGAPVGVMAAAMATDTISRAVSQWHNGKSGFAVLLDETDKVIAHPDQGFVLAEKRLGDHPLVTKEEPAGNGMMSFGPGEDRIGVIRVNAMGWRLILEQEKNEAFGELYNFQRFMVLVFGCVVVMVLGIAWLYARISVSPVIRMINAGLNREKNLKNRLQEMRKMEALGTFAGGIAHDFNNILGAITTCSEMAIEDVDEKNPAHEDLKHILKAATRGKKLVKQILEYSRSRNTRQKPVKLHRIILECLDLFKTFKPDRIEVVLNIASKLDFILADPTQLHQVVMNLLLNAEHAMAGKGTLTISLAREAATDIPADLPNDAGHDHFLHLAVTDTGCGMAPHVLERMFDPFYTTHMNTGGTGLGLAMSDVIIRRHQGLITAESELGKGSVFHIYLPCAGDADLPDEADPAEPEALTGTEHILFVDDDVHMVYSASKMLRRLGYTVTTAENADQAVDLFKKAPGTFDLLITDRVMPGRSGVELAHDIRAIRPGMPVILCSGFFNKRDDTFLDAACNLEELVDEFVSKPFEIKPVSRAIRGVLDRKDHA